MVKKNKSSLPPERKQPELIPGRWRERLRSLQPEWVFCVLAVLFGMPLLVLTPPCQVPDEEAHFRRAFEISEGRVVALKEGDYTGDYLPRGIKTFLDRFQPMGIHLEQRTSFRDLRDAAAIRLDSNEREFAIFSNAAVHTPLIYLPQAAAIAALRPFCDCVLVLFYAARVCNFLVAAGLTFLAIRTTPIARWGFAGLALTPMALALMASLSSDALTNALAFLLIATVLAHAAGPGEHVSGGSLARLALLSASLGLVKQAYFLLPMSYLLIPVRMLGSKWRYLAGFFLVNGITLLAVAGWGRVVRDIYSPADMRLGMNPPEQIRLLREQPGEFVLAVIETAKHIDFIGEEYLGMLGMADLKLPPLIYVLQLAALVGLFAGDSSIRTGLSVRQAIVAAAMAAILCLTVLVVIHITWDAPGAKVVSVQGRYFIPAGPLIGIAVGRLCNLPTMALRKIALTLPVLVCAAAPVVLLSALVGVYERYFVETPQTLAAKASARGEALMQEPDTEERARSCFEEAVRLDPDNATAHHYLGILLKDTRPDQAVEHLRMALKISPEDASALNNLALILARRGELPEAIRLYREALRLSPDPKVQENLDKALAMRDALLAKMRQIPRALEEFMTRSGMLQEKYSGESQAGQYLKSIHGPIVDGAGRPIFRVEFVWRCPPPSGADIRVLAATGAAPADGKHVPFYACAARSTNGNRIFVFPAPVDVAVLWDEEVSWYYQMPLAELTPSEHDREMAYRRQQHLRFPLENLPE